MNNEVVHGIDHCGQFGYAPILVVGGPIVEQDLVLRDLSSIQGVRVSQHGIGGKLPWRKLNLVALFSMLPKIKYLDIDMESVVDFSDLEDQWGIEYLQVNCPASKGGVKKKLSVKHATVRWSDESIKLVLEGADYLEVARVKASDFQVFEGVNNIRSLRISNAKNLNSAFGLQNLDSLESLDVSDCQRLTEMRICFGNRSLKRISFWGCRNLQYFEGLDNLPSLEKLEFFSCGKEITVRSVPNADPRIVAKGSAIRFG